MAVLQKNGARILQGEGTSIIATVAPTKSDIVNAFETFQQFYELCIISFLKNKNQ